MTKSFHPARSILLAAALAGLGFLGGSIARARWLDASTSPAPAAALAIDHTADLHAGPAAAPVTVRIFGDYECPACRQLELTLGDTLLAFANAGHIRLVYLHRPLAARRDADQAAAAIACEPDLVRRWSVHRRLYDPAALPPADDAATLAVRALRLVSADSARLSCFRSDTILRHARAAITAARNAGFHEVPTVLVDDRTVHYRTYHALLRHIRRALTDTR
jgi:protein-disulfide isomerase